MAPIVQVRFVLTAGGDDQQSRVVVLDEDGSVLIQRSSDDRSKNLPSNNQNLNIANGAVSRLHAKIYVKKEPQLPSITTDYAVYIKDCDSRHGTYLNNHRLDRGGERKLLDGDNVRLGIDIARPLESKFAKDFKSPWPFVANPLRTASFKAPAYRLSIVYLNGNETGRRGISYAVPDEIDSTSDYGSEDDDYSDSDGLSAIEDMVQEAYPEYHDQAAESIRSSPMDIADEDQMDEIKCEDILREEEELVLDALESQNATESPQLTPSAPLHTDYAQAFDTLGENLLCDVASSDVEDLKPDLKVPAPVIEDAQQGRMAEAAIDLSGFAALTDIPPMQSSRKRSYEAAMLHDEEVVESAQVIVTEQPVMPTSETASAILEQSVIIDSQTTTRQLQEPYDAPVSADVSTIRPAKRSRLGVAAWGVGMFLAGSTSTFAALAYLPDFV